MLIDRTAGSSVRNVPAFQALHNTFVKSATAGLCSIVLDAISTLFHSDPANYFILEPQNTLNQFAEKIHLKSPDVQVVLTPIRSFRSSNFARLISQDKFFKLLEFVVFQLNYVPCKELISLSLLLRNHAATHVQCAIRCMTLLLTVLR